MISRVNSGVMEGDVPVGLMDNVLREVGKIYVPGCAMDSRIIWCSTDSFTLKNVSIPGFPCMIKSDAHGLFHRSHLFQMMGMASKLSETPL